MASHQTTPVAKGCRYRRLLQRNQTDPDDGIESDFTFDAYEDALPAWRYPNLTQQTDFLGHVVRMTIEVEMSKEASYLRDIERARSNVKDYLEGPNSDIDQIIRSIRDNGWTLSNKLRKAFPMLEDPRLAEDIIEAVREVLDPDYLEVIDDEDGPQEPGAPSL